MLPMKRTLVAIALLAAAGVTAQTLPDRKDVVSWKLLAQVELVKVKDRFQPQFSAGVAALDAKEVKVQGFMMPLEMGDNIRCQQTPFCVDRCRPRLHRRRLTCMSRVRVEYGAERPITCEETTTCRRRAGPPNASVNTNTSRKDCSIRDEVKPKPRRSPLVRSTRSELVRASQQPPADRRSMTSPRVGVVASGRTRGPV